NRSRATSSPSSSASGSATISRSRTAIARCRRSLFRADVMTILARLALAVLLLAALAAPGIAAEQILSFDARIVVRNDGVLDVTETIKVDAEGDEIRRGIYRDFPLTFEDDDGRIRRVSFDVVSVMRDGRPEPYHTNTNSEGV